MTQKIIRTIPLCSRCMNYEINSWLNENINNVNPESMKEINQELRAIKLTEGQCIVCNHKMISDDICHRILRILEESRLNGKTVEDFRKFFCFEDE